MRYLTTPILILVIVINSYAQSNKFTFSNDNFEKEIIAYQPKQDNVSDKDFKHAVFVLNEVKKDVNIDPLGFNRADYYNILNIKLNT